MSAKMRSEITTVKSADGKPVLDFDKDIWPELDKWIDETQPKTQEEVYQQFKDLKYLLTVERLQGKQRKAERDGKKSGLRGESQGATIPEGKVPARTGNPQKDIDNILDHFGVH